MTTDLNRRGKSKTSILVAFLVLIGGFFTMFSAGASRSVSEEETSLGSGAPLVQTVNPVKVKGSYTVSAPGRLRARQGTAIIGEVAGKIVWVSENFVIGARLKEGDLLFRIDPSDFEVALKTAEANLASAKASLVLARKAYKRQSELVEGGFTSGQTADDARANLAIARANVSSAEAQLAQAKRNLARTEIRAPYPARVISELVAPDTYVAPGQQLAAITDTRLGELQAGLTPRDTKALAKALVRGDKVTAIAKPNEGSIGTGRLEGYVDRFSPIVDGTSRTAQVIALFPRAFEPEHDGKIFGDDYMTLEIKLDIPETVWQLPAGSVRKDTYVWAVRDGKLVDIPVSVLSRTASHTLVTSAVALGDENIMTTLLNEEYQDQPVTLAKNTAAAN